MKFWFKLKKLSGTSGHRITINYFTIGKWSCPFECSPDSNSVPLPAALELPRGELEESWQPEASLWWLCSPWNQFPYTVQPSCSLHGLGALVCDHQQSRRTSTEVPNNPLAENICAVISCFHNWSKEAQAKLHYLFCQYQEARHQNNHK